MEGYQRGGWGKGEKVQGIRSVIGKHKLDGESPKMVQETEFKELIRTTNGHELRWGMLEGQAMQGRGRKIKGGNWDNCNSIINKIYLKKQLNLKKQKQK